MRYRIYFEGCLDGICWYTRWELWQKRGTRQDSVILNQAAKRRQGHCSINYSLLFSCVFKICLALIYFLLAYSQVLSLSYWSLAHRTMLAVKAWNTLKLTCAQNTPFSNYIFLFGCAFFLQKFIYSSIHLCIRITSIMTPVILLKGSPCKF